MHTIGIMGRYYIIYKSCYKNKIECFEEGGTNVNPSRVILGRTLPFFFLAPI